MAERDDTKPETALEEMSATKLLEEVTWHQKQINRLLATLLVRVAEETEHGEGKR